MNSFESALERKEQHELAYDAASRVLKAFPRLPNGLVTDATRADREYKSAKKACEKAFADLRAFNQKFMRKYGKQYSQYMRDKRGVA